VFVQLAAAWQNNHVLNSELHCKNNISLPRIKQPYETQQIKQKQISSPSLLYPAREADRPPATIVDKTVLHKTNAEEFCHH